MKYLVKSVTKSASGYTVVGHQIVPPVYGEAPTDQKKVNTGKTIQLNFLSKEEADHLEPEVTVLTVGESA